MFINILELTKCPPSQNNPPPPMSDRNGGTTCPSQNPKCLQNGLEMTIKNAFEIATKSTTYITYLLSTDHFRQPPMLALCWHLCEHHVSKMVASCARHVGIILTSC